MNKCLVIMTCMMICISLAIIFVACDSGGDDDGNHDDDGDHACDLDCLAQMDDEAFHDCQRDCLNDCLGNEDCCEQCSSWNGECTEYHLESSRSCFEGCDACGKAMFECINTCDSSDEDCVDSCLNQFDICMDTDSDCIQDCNDQVDACRNLCDDETENWCDFRLCIVEDCEPGYKACMESCWYDGNVGQGGADDEDTDTDGDEDCNDTWIDVNTNLMWQNCPDGGDCYNWYEAQNRCAEEAWAGHSDWRLPSISELRSLIRGCEATETGGYCGVTDLCLDSFDCWNSACGGCSPGGGPGPDGRFWPAELEGGGVFYWSSSERAETDDQAWGIFFDFASVNKYPVYVDNITHVRCVR